MVLDEVDRDLYLQPASALWLPPGSRGVFGGQIIASSLLAAERSCADAAAQASEGHPPHEAYPLHSCHAYFLRPGNAKKPVVYHVDRLRDGGSFQTRAVTARQGGQAIFSATFSFHRIEQDPSEGVFGHQVPIPDDVPAPESLTSLHDQIGALLSDSRLPPALKPYISMMHRAPFPVEVRPCEPRDLLAPVPLWPARHRVWMRCQGLPDPGSSADAVHMHRAAVAFSSDWLLAATSLLPYGLTWGSRQLAMAASLDHSMWFHDPFQAAQQLAPAAAPAAAAATAQAAAATQQQPGAAAGGSARGGSGSGSSGSPKPVPAGVVVPPVRRHPQAPGVPPAPAPSVRADDWLLYELESPALRGARGLNTGRVFTRDGRLVVTAVQEALLRVRGATPPAAPKA